MIETPKSSSIISKLFQPSSWFSVLEDNEQNEHKVNPEIGNWTSICWLNYPNVDWDIGWYFTIRGAESLHLYLWVLKDLSWTQDWFVSGHIFGILAVLWNVFLLQRSYQLRNIKEIWTGIGQFLWLFANLWWMSGELHDFSYPLSERWYTQRTIEAGYIMEAALIWLMIYYLFIKPFHILAPTKESEKAYDDTGLNPRFSFLFATWRDILFWLGKDFGWNQLNPYIWIFFLIPTLLIAFDFVAVSLFQKTLLIEHCHYIAQVTWVVGNLLWAYGEIFYPLYDYPFDLFSRSKTRLRTYRWYSSWTLLLAFVPIVILYVIWFKKDYKEENHHESAHIRSKIDEFDVIQNPIIKNNDSSIKYEDSTTYGSIVDYYNPIITKTISVHVDSDHDYESSS